MGSRVVIIGGGFGGVKCARTLRKLLPADKCEIVLFNRENHMVFHPLLAEVACAVIQPRDVGAPLRQLLKDVHCRSEEVLSVEPEQSEIEYKAEDGRRRRMRFDHLVLSAGNAVNLSMIPGMSDHAYPMKTIGDALALQGRIMEALENAEVAEDPERRRMHLSFIVVGGGFSGVEVAGEINDLVRRSVKFFQNIREEDISVYIVHSREQILPEVSASLRDFARQKMEAHGVKILVNAQASLCTHEGVGLKDGRFIRGGTVVCTIGTRPLPFVERLNVEKNRGRVVTAADMSLPGHPSIWAIGDSAAVVNAIDGEISPPTAQFAERQGAQVARNIVRRMAGEPTRPFAHRSQGSLCSIGGQKAVAEIMGLRIAGFPAWFVWRGVYLFKLPSLAQKVKVGMEWFCDLIFPRTLAHLKADPTNRVARAFYAAGDYLFQPGDPASDFYMIEAGEVEVLAPDDGDGQLEAVARLGPGDFFGEAALIDSRPRKNAVRAISDVEVIVMGQSVFTQMSSSLSPLKDAVAAAVKRRVSIWKHLPEVRGVLDAIPLGQLMEPLPAPPLNPESSLGAAVGCINQKRLDCCFIVEDDGRLAGLVTRTDLLQALEVAARLTIDRQYEILVRDIMVRHPIAVTVDDTVATAVSVMREHQLKRVPVVSGDGRRVLAGYLRIENIMETAIKRMLEERSASASTS